MGRVPRQLRRQLGLLRFLSNPARRPKAGGLRRTADRQRQALRLAGKGLGCPRRSGEHLVHGGDPSGRQRQRLGFSRRFLQLRSRGGAVHDPVHAQLGINSVACYGTTPQEPGPCQYTGSGLHFLPQPPPRRCDDRVRRRLDPFHRRKFVCNTCGRECRSTGAIRSKRRDAASTAA